MLNEQSYGCIYPNHASELLVGCCEGSDLTPGLVVVLPTGSARFCQRRRRRRRWRCGELCAPAGPAGRVRRWDAGAALPAGPLLPHLLHGGPALLQVGGGGGGGVPVHKQQGSGGGLSHLTVQ